MKTFFLYFAVLVSTSIYAQELLLQTRIHPNTDYQTGITTIMEDTMDIQGPEEMMNQPGSPFPMSMIERSEVVMLVTTGATLEDHTIPAVLDFQKNTSTRTLNGIEQEPEADPMKGVKLYGHYTDRLYFKIDSITPNSDLGTSFKQLVQTLLDQMQNNLQFPNEPLSVGSTFEQHMPLDIPVGQNKMQANIVSEFTLERVAGDDVFFSVRSAIEMNTQISDSRMEISGQGTGTMVYNKALDHYTRHDTRMPMKFEVALSEEVTLTGSFETLSEMRVAITENKERLSGTP